MRILVVGASKGTGSLAVKAALARGHDVTAFARNPDRLGFENPQLTKASGDFHVADNVDRVMPGHDAVIVTASAASIAGFKQDPTFFSRGTALVISAMKAHGVPRLVVLSALGVGETRKVSGWLAEKLLFYGLFKYPYTDHERQEQDARGSGLEWVIARPARLTNGAATGTYAKTTSIERFPLTWSVSRADVADFLVEAAATKAWVGKGVQLGG